MSMGYIQMGYFCLHYYVCIFSFDKQFKNSSLNIILHVCGELNKHLLLICSIESKIHFKKFTMAISLKITILKKYYMRDSFAVFYKVIQTQLSCRMHNPQSV